MPLKNRLYEFYNSRKTLDSKVFAIVLIVGTLITALSTIVTVIEDLGPGASAATFACFLFIIIMGYVAYGLKKEEICHVLLCLFLNLVLLPVTFFLCGGVRSGMVLYFMTCLYIVVPCVTEKKLRAFIFSLSVVSLCLVIFLSTFVIPEKVADITDEAWYIDVIISLILNTICIYYMSHLTVASYEQERIEKEKLLSRLEVLAVKDELTGLYNRREMYARLGQSTNTEKKRRFLILFDIDDFKKVNDTCGHIFGDKVLRTISEELIKALDTDSHEFAARYGGEEFIYVIFSADREEAIERAEKIRKLIYGLKYEEHPEKHISISSGLVEIQDDENASGCIKAADELLYIAKSTGKNKVVFDKLAT